MTSSLRNSVHRRNHKERSQLTHRSKLGLLEKHADYVKRARDYHSKQDRLTRLKQKAAERNKDEFYFSMTGEKTKGGVHVKDRGNVALPTDIVKVLKTQDENYVRTIRAAGLKKIDKIKQQLMEMADLLRQVSTNNEPTGMEDSLEKEEIAILKEAGIIDSKGKGRSVSYRKPQHIVFVDNEAEASTYSFNRKSTDEIIPVTSEASIDPEQLGWKLDELKQTTRKRHTSTKSDAEQKMVIDTETNGSLNKKRLLKELASRLGRDKQLRYAEREFEMQRLMMGKGSRQKIVGAEKVEGDDMDVEDEDEIDSRKGKRRAVTRKVDEATYKPRVYKWRLERKR